MINIIDSIIQYLKDNKDSIEISITIFSFFLSCVAILKSVKADKLQNRLSELELKLKQYEVKKIEKEQAEENSACVEARVISLGRDQHRMKVWNSGKAVAYNVTARFDGNVGLILPQSDKQPFEELEPGKNYELVVIAYDGSSSKFKIITEWEDSEGKKCSKTQLRDIQSS